MRKSDGLTSVVREVAAKAAGLTLGLLVCIAGAVGFALLPPLVLERIVNRLTAGQTVALRLALLYFGVLAISGVFEAAQNVLITVFGQKVTHGLRRQMCRKLSRLPAAYFTENEAGKITSRFVSDVDAVDSLFTNGIISMAADGCKVISIVAIIFVKSRGLGVLMLLVTPLLFLMTRHFQSRMLGAQVANRVAVGKVNNHVPETIRNIRMIHTLFRERYMEERYDAYISESYRATETSNHYDALYSPIIIFISSCIIAVMMICASIGGGMQQFFGLSVGTAVAIIAYVGKVFDPLESIGMEIQNIQSAVAGIRRINAFLQQAERKSADTTLTCDKLLQRDGARIRFHHVFFGYDPAQPVLTDQSFDLGAGETATLVGRTGAGKSTAFRLLLGLYSPDAGQVSVCGAPADEIPDTEKRRLFGYVEQTFHLVSGTVGEQISLFDPAIGQAQIERAATLVGLHEAILALPTGYDTPAADSLFSQGQFQLLSIARAVAADPAILLLDEITANLDSGTERRVIEALERASANRTVLSISHRLYEQTAVGRLIHIHGETA